MKVFFIEKEYLTEYMIQLRNKAYLQQVTCNDLMNVKIELLNETENKFTPNIQY